MNPLLGLAIVGGLIVLGLGVMAFLSLFTKDPPELWHTPSPTPDASHAPPCGGAWSLPCSQPAPPCWRCITLEDEMESAFALFFGTILYALGALYCSMEVDLPKSINAPHIKSGMAILRALLWPLVMVFVVTSALRPFYAWLKTL